MALVSKIMNQLLILIMYNCVTSAQIVHTYSVTGTSVFEMEMLMYIDQSFQVPYSQLPVFSTMDTMFVEVKMKNPIWDLFPVLDACWGNPIGEPDVQYVFIKDGCISTNPQRGKILTSGSIPISRFQQQVFAFHSGGSLTIHCNVTVCVHRDGKSCVPTCPKANERKRRAAPDETKQVSANMKIKILAVDSDSKEPENESDMWEPGNLALLIGALVLGAATIAAVITIICLNYKKDKNQPTNRHLTKVSVPEMNLYSTH